MNIWTLILTGISLAMDASAVSLAKGMALPKPKLKQYAFVLAFTFGFFQALMPVIGYVAGSQFANRISSIDHWIAFLLLCWIGLNMIKEGKEKKSEESLDSIPWKTILTLGIATSIDALAIGVTFAFLKVQILRASLIIGIVTFAFSFVCVMIGKKLGIFFQNYAEYFGGGLLVVLGIKILFEHLFL